MIGFYFPLIPQLLPQPSGLLRQKPKVRLWRLQLLLIISFTDYPLSFSSGFPILPDLLSLYNLGCPWTQGPASDFNSWDYKHTPPLNPWLLHLFPSHLYLSAGHILRFSRTHPLFCVLQQHLPLNYSSNQADLCPPHTHFSPFSAWQSVIFFKSSCLASLKIPQYPQHISDTFPWDLHRPDLVPLSSWAPAPLTASLPLMTRNPLGSLAIDCIVPLLPLRPSYLLWWSPVPWHMT